LARDRAISVLDRLTQRIEDLKREFREFVEEQKPVMRKRHLTRPDPQAYM